jgi:hypothetical protein
MPMLLLRAVTMGTNVAGVDAEAAVDAAAPSRAASVAMLHPAKLVRSGKVQQNAPIGRRAVSVVREVREEKEVSVGIVVVVAIATPIVHRARNARRVASVAAGATAATPRMRPPAAPQMRAYPTGAPAVVARQRQDVRMLRMSLRSTSRI